MPVVSLSMSDEDFKQLQTVAAFMGRSVETLALCWVQDKIEAFLRSRCLVPSCPSTSVSGGLCQKHYMRLRYYLSRGLLDLGWLIRHGRILGEDTSGVAQETLETLPKLTKILRRGDPATLWFFGWPEAQKERERLRGAPTPT